MFSQQASTATQPLNTTNRTEHVASYTQWKQSAAADLAFSEYNFGDGVEVTGSSSWSHTAPGVEWTCKVYVEEERVDDGPAPRTVLTFTVNFSAADGTFVGAVAQCDKGSEWGAIPPIPEEIEALGFKSTADYIEHQAFLVAANQLRLSQAVIQSCGSSFLQHPSSGCTGIFDAEFIQYADMSGQPFILVGIADPKGYDAAESGEMFVIRFASGVEIAAWPEEVISATQDHSAQELVKVYETGNDSTGWNAKVMGPNPSFQVQVFDADGDRRPEHEKALATAALAKAWADKVVQPDHGKLPVQVAVDEKVCHVIAQAIQLYMDDQVIVSKAELIRAIQSHMSAREQGMYFFEVRQTLNNMIALGAYTSIEASIPGGRRTELIAQHGVGFSQNGAIMYNA